MGNKEEVFQKIRESFEMTAELNELRYEGCVTDLDFFGLFCKATAKDKLFKFSNFNSCMFNCVYDKSDSILMLFSTPINDDSGTKQLADKVMKITEMLEECFTTLDYISSREVREDKFIYITIVKKLAKK